MYFQHQWSPAEIDELMTIFFKLDLNKNDKIEADELASALNVFSSVRQLDVKNCQKYIDEVDLDASGDLDWIEFLRVIESIQYDKNKSHLGEVFEKSGVFDFLDRFSSNTDEDLTQSIDDVLVCSICFLNERDIMLKPCSHVAICHACNEKEEKKTSKIRRNRKCPVCKSYVTSTKRIMI